MGVGKFEVILGDLECCFGLSQLLVLRVELHQQLVSVLRQTGQPVDLILEAADLGAIGRPLSRVDFLLLELGSKLCVLFLNRL